MARWLSDLTGEISRAGIRAIDTTTIQAEADFKATAPVLTGEYRAGIHAVPARRTSDGAEGRDDFEAPHSPIVHRRNGHQLPIIARMEDRLKSEFEAEVELVDGRVD